MTPPPAATLRDVLILGAGASGLMCGLTAGQHQRSVLILDHSRHPAEKVRISGGGRCNFSNRDIGAMHYHGQWDPTAPEPFCMTALRRAPPARFLALLKRHRIGYHEEAQGKLFCDRSAQDIVRMLQEACHTAAVELELGTTIRHVTRAIPPDPDPESGRGPVFSVATDRGTYHGRALVVATGGLSIPRMGASDLGYRIAKQFGLRIIPPQPALVPLLFDEATRTRLGSLSGITVPAGVRTAGAQFTDDLLFTHRGLSGPVILQISSFWTPGESLTIDFFPGRNLQDLLHQARQETPRRSLRTVLSHQLPSRLVDHFADIGLESAPIPYDRKLAELSNAQLQTTARLLQAWPVTPKGSEGFRTAEVTRGGVDTRELDPGTLECRSVPGLYFIGEVVDVTGQLGGFNLQWAWSSGMCVGMCAGMCVGNAV